MRGKPARLKDSFTPTFQSPIDALRPANKSLQVHCRKDFAWKGLLVIGSLVAPFTKVRKFLTLKISGLKKVPFCRSSKICKMGLFLTLKFIRLETFLVLGGNADPTRDRPKLLTTATI